MSASNLFIPFMDADQSGRSLPVTTFGSAHPRRIMPPSSSDRLDIAQTATVMLVTLVALAAFALVAAYWTWQWLAPEPSPPGQAPIEGAAHGLSVGDLFGKPAPQQSSAVAATGAISLLGIVSSTEGRSGYAVLRIEPGEILAVREGDEVAPAIRLRQVSADHVILERSGTRETLVWPKKSAAPGFTPIMPPPVAAARQESR